MADTPRFSDAARAGIAVLTVALGFVVGQLLALGLAVVLTHGAALPGWLAAVLVALADVISLVAVVLVARTIFAQRTPADFGFRRARIGPATGWTLLALFSVFVITVLWNMILHNTDVRDGADALLGGGLTERIVAAVVITVLAPIAEEILFRGFLFTALRRWLGGWPGAAVSGVLFAVAHIGSSDWSALLPLAVLGFLACLLYWVTGSLLAPIALHCLQNGLATTGGVGLPLIAAPALMATAVLVALLLLAPISTAPARPAVLTDEQPQQ